MTSRTADHASERDNLLQPGRLGRDGRSLSTFSLAGRSNAPSSAATHGNAPGSFSADLKSTAASRVELTRPEPPTFTSYRSTRIQDGEDKDTTDARQAELREAIAREEKIKSGSENLLEALNTKSAKQAREQRLKVESELNASNRKIAALRLGLEAEIQRSKDRSPSPVGRLSKLFRNVPTRSQSRHELDDTDVFVEEDTESPTFVLSEILQSLEREGMPSEYYVERANNLVDLFKRHSTLKYDLAWSIFGLRMQTMLLSDSREVVAASFRLMRHAITDRKSLAIMRSLHTDYLVTLSLVKESKASVEREQALKFVRAFLDVKDGTKELARSIIRVVVAIAELHEDRLQSISLLTLAELLVRDPALVVSAGGIGVLADALADGTYQPSESLAHAFVFLLDTPARRIYLKSGHEIEGPLSTFTDGTCLDNAEKLRNSARIVATILKSWPGLSAFAMDNFRAIRSLTNSLHVVSPLLRNIVLDLIFEVLRIKSPSWSTSFLAGRRLTTYGRVGSFKPDLAIDGTVTSTADQSEELVDHFTSTMLAVFLRCNLLEALLLVIDTEQDLAIKRKSTLLLSEVLRKAYERLPSTWSTQMQVLPSLFQKASLLQLPDARYISSGAIYQLESVTRTLLRTGQAGTSVPIDQALTGQGAGARRISDLSKDSLTPQIEEGHFRAVIMDTQVLATVNYTKWRWDLILKIIEGPLLNPKRLEEATKTNKFVKRLMSFYRPFKYRFSEILNTKPNQRYVRTGCALLRTLLQNPEGVKYLAEQKFLRQVAECLAQVDRLSGLTSTSPLFSAERLSETLSGGYFTLLGTMSSSAQGVEMMERWKMMNMFYHIVELEDRDDLIKLLLSSMDYTLDSHLRVILSKALTSCSRPVRIYATRILRKYATRQMLKSDTFTADSAYVEWAIQLLITQLYDPEIDVCEAAVQILQEACNEADSLEYVVRCRPALDHLGEIGAPLLLRFLSTSIGYHYLDDLDYISQEMDDWFLGRNDSYVMLVEASLAQALTRPQQQRRTQPDEHVEPIRYGAAPPHFYRELTRTAEGCKLLQSKGHFEDFVTIIRTHRVEHTDAEVILKLKGAIWAIGNIGSMELSAPFLESSDVIKLIIRIAESSVVMSVRGTAYFALGLVSRSIHGQEILAEQGWEVAVDDMGNSLGICLPADFGKLFLTRAEAQVDSSSAMDVNDENPAQSTAITDEDPINKRILDLVKDLGNPVLAKKRATELHTIKVRQPELFQHSSFFHKVMKLLERHHFRLPVLRFVIDLFDKQVMRRIVLDDEDDSGPDDDSEDDTTVQEGNAAAQTVN